VSKAVRGLIVVALLLSLLAPASAETRLRLKMPGILDTSPEAYRAPPMSPEARRDAEAKLAEARAAYEKNKSDADALIWLGRRTAYLGRFDEAIKIYSNGIGKHPRDARMYRHRGHRFITTRRFRAAVSDLEKAAQLIKGRTDEVEPDGLPNARGVPTSTLGSNVWYHLGLARYLLGDFTGALEAYRECEKFSKNPDMVVATSHWLYMTLRRLKRDGEARRVLEPITPGMEIIENGDYYRLLLMYKGETTPEQLLAEAAKEKAGVGYATAVYGVGNWHIYTGRPEKALALFLELMQLPQRTSFGYIAAEFELERMGVRGYPREMPRKTIN
jgi:tetratricopeptide (TPR) repeat protein